MRWDSQHLAIIKANELTPPQITMVLWIYLTFRNAVYGIW